MPRGRPCKLTPALQAKICGAIREGNYREVAAGWAGVPLSTFKSWITKGRKQASGQYRDFVDALLQAEREAEHRMVKLVALAAKDDAKHAEWWLTRKFPERWGQDREAIKQLLREVSELRRAIGERPAEDPGGRGPGEGGSPPDGA